MCSKMNLPLFKSIKDSLKMINRCRHFFAKSDRNRSRGHQISALSVLHFPAPNGVLQVVSMRVKAANNKGLKEPSTRKSKKLDRKESCHGKEKVEDKKQRRPIQNNRFTSIDELPNPTKNMPLELFGSLVFNFSKETSDVQISDSTGDYELRVSTETLTEFKLKVLLGVDHRSKPKFTILLGDCQCYPELPEGTLVMKKATEKIEDECVNENLEEQIRVIMTPEKRQSIEAVQADTVSDFDETTASKLEQDTACSLGEAVKRDNGVPPGDTQKCKSEIGCTGLRAKHGDTPRSEDELTRHSKRSGREKSAQNLHKHRNREYKRDSKKIRSRSITIQDSASTYLSNLEGFIKFLMNDEICCTALKTTKAPPNFANVARRIVSGRNMIRYSDGREFVITFEEKNTPQPRKVKSAGKNDTSECPPNSFKSDSDSSLATLKELLSSSDDKTGKRLEEELRAREELVDAKAFVEEVKKELMEWQARCEETIDVMIVGSEKSIIPGEKSNVNVSKEVPDVQNALQKVEEVYEDANSYSTNLAQADSLEHFFLELDKYDKMTVSKETKSVTNEQNTGDKGSPSEVVDGGKLSPSSKKKNGVNFNQTTSTTGYSPPFPLNMTSTADIELMWSSFVKQFYPDDERLETPTSNTADGTTHRLCNSDLHIEQYRQRFSGFECSTKPNDLTRQKSLDGNFYPGQHCFPYFVEANLKRVNSVMSSYKVSTSHKSLVNQQERDFSLMGCPPFHSTAPQPNYNLPAGIHILNPNKMNLLRERRENYPLQRNANTLPQERFTSRRNRIFFNPNVSAGDWY